MSKNTGTSELINYFDLGVNGDVGIAGSLDINTIANATTDTDKFLVSDSGLIKYRTGAELLSDIGGQGLLTNPVTGTGTTNYLPKFTGASTIGNSVIQDTGTTVTISSNLVAINGNGITEFKINNNTSEWEFYMPAGSTDLRLYRGTDKVNFFANGNVLVGTGTDAGYKLDVNGTGRFSGDLTINKASGYATIITDAPSGVDFIFKQGGVVKHEIFTNSNQFAIYNTTTSSVALGIANATGAATFSSSVTANGDILGFGNLELLNGSGAYVLIGEGTGANQYGVIDWNAANNRLQIATQNFAFGSGGGQISLYTSGNVSIGTTTDSGFKLDVNGTGRFKGASASPTLTLANSTGGTLADFTITENTGLIVNSYEGATARSIDFRVANSSALLISSTGAATFSSSVTSQVNNISADGAGVVLQGYVDNNLRIAVRGSGYNDGARAGLIAAAGDFSGQVAVQNNSGIIVGAGFRAFIRQTIGGDAEIGASAGGVLYLFNNGSSALSFNGAGAATFTNTASGNALRLYTSYASGRALNFGFSDGSVLPTAAFYIGNQTNVGVFIGDETTTNGLYVKANGNVGIGTTDPQDKLEIKSGYLRMFDPTSGINGGYAIMWSSNNGGTNVTYAHIDAITTSAGNRTGDLIFRTANAGAPTEKMRITSGGFFKASTNGTYVSSGGYHELRTNQNARALLITNSSTTLSQENGLDIIFTAASPNNATSKFIVCEDTSAFRFIVYSNGNVANTNNSYGSISDIKLKENIIDASPKLNDLLKVKVRNYNLIGEEAKQIGVIAQELEEIFPAMVDESIDKDKDGNDLGTTTKSVKYSVFVPMLIKAIQEQQVQIQELKNKLS